MTANQRPRRQAFRSFRGVFLALSALLTFMVILDIGMGAADVNKSVTPGLVLRVIGSHLPVISAHVAPPPDFVDRIVWYQRLPRALGGAIIGMLLAMAGVAFQGLLLNPLADPYMVGVSAGSALGSVTIIMLGGATLLAGFALPLGAFAAGLLATLIVYGLARVGGRLSAQTFLLAGIVVGTFFWSLIPLALSLAKDQNRRGEILGQLLGNLQSVEWRSLVLLIPFAIMGALTLWLGARELDLMAQGEETAAHLGVNTEGFKRRTLVAGSLVTAAAVSVAGIIAFVGMVTPHIARRLVGPKHAVLLPTAMLLGGLTLVVSDWISRVFLSQLEVGVITSLLGAPVFCYLLRHRMTVRW